MSSIVLDLNGGHITVWKENDGYRIIDESFTSGGYGMTDAAELIFLNWDEEVLNLDDDEELAFFGMSRHLDWNGVELTPEFIGVKDLHELKEVLQHVTLGAYCPYDF